MNKMTIDGLLKAFESDHAKRSRFVGLAVRIEGAEAEYIINHKANFDSKKAYYAKAYDENLCLKANPNIKIIGYAFGDSFEDIELALY